VQRSTAGLSHSSSTHLCLQRDACKWTGRAGPSATADTCHHHLQQQQFVIIIITPKSGSERSTKPSEPPSTRSLSCQILIFYLSRLCALHLAPEVCGSYSLKISPSYSQNACRSCRLPLLPQDPLFPTGFQLTYRLFIEPLRREMSTD